MSVIRIGVDYSNICKDYNTAYLDRDNKDPATSRCMKQVVAWMHALLDDISQAFGYVVYSFHGADTVKTGEVASNRFLFYSLEKEITLQSFVLQREAKAYQSLQEWIDQSTEGVVVSNDEDGEGVYFHVRGSEMHAWMRQRFGDFTLDETVL